MMSRWRPALAKMASEFLSPSRSSFVWLVTLCNAILFAVEMLENNCPQDKKQGSKDQGDADTTREGSCVLQAILGRFAFEPLKANPLFGPRTDTFLDLGALYTPFIVEEGEWWRLLSAVFLHGGLVHLLLNTIGILQLGRYIHREFGFWRTGLIYIVSGVGASLFSAVFIAGMISVGASGALFGLYGAIVSDVIVNWSLMDKPLTILIVLLVNAAINLAIGLLPFVDNFAHIGGFIFGSLIGFLLLIKPVYRRKRDRCPSTEICEAFSDNDGEVPGVESEIEMADLSEREASGSGRKNSGRKNSGRKGSGGGSIIRTTIAPADADDSESKPIYEDSKPLRQPKQTHQKCLFITASVLLLVIPVALLSILISGADVYRFCHWCRHVNCIETSSWDCSVGSIVTCTYIESVCGTSQNCIRPDCCHCNEAQIECSYTLKKKGGADVSCDYLDETAHVDDWTDTNEYSGICEEACSAYSAQLNQSPG